MKDLITALEIFAKYRSLLYPTYCGKAQLCIATITKEEISEIDKAKLKELSFFWSTEYGCWASYRFGNTTYN